MQNKQKIIIVALIIIISILLYSLMFKKKQSQEVLSAKPIIKSYGISGGDDAPTKLLPDSIANETNKRYPQVIAFTNKIMRTVPLEKFVWLEKTDGLHMIIIIYNNDLYVREKESIKYIRTIKIKDMKPNVLTILDGELYEDKYYVFDACKIEDEDISKLTFIDRMSKAYNFINKIENNYIILKQYFKPKNWKEVVEFSKNNISPKTNMHIDGVILQRIDMEYFVNSSCKLKRPVMNTIDFMLKYDTKTKCFWLYLYGTYGDIIYNPKLLPKINKLSKEHTGLDLQSREKLPDRLYILFSNVFIENTHLLIPRKRWDHTGYKREEVVIINEYMTKMLQNPEYYDGKIMECSWAPDGWVVLRDRTDKSYSNSYSVGIDTMSILFSPIEVDQNIYFEKVKDN